MIKPLTAQGKAFFVLTNLLGGSLYLFAFIFCVIRPSGPLPWGYIALFLATLAAGLASVRIPGIGSLVSVTDTFVFMAVLFYGPVPAVLLAGTDGFLSTRRHSGRLLSAFSSLSVMSISVLTAGLVYRNLLEIFWQPHFGTPMFEQILVPVSGMALVHFLLNSMLVAALTAFARRMSVYRTWRENYLWTSLTFFSGAFAAAIAYLFIQRLGPIAFAVSLPILGITYFTYKTYLDRVQEKNDRISQMNTVHLGTIEALAMAIDAKGQTTYGHLRRVQAYAVGLAELVGVDEETFEGIRAAALLHDVGKLAVPDYILNKPTSLTAHELVKIRTYPRIGAEILGNVQFPYPIVPFIRNHQEHWDGSGYPDGLSGEEIPLGARILGIADCADAMRCTRPYRSPVSREEVVRYLRQASGREFDPKLVEVFCTNYDALDAQVQGVGLPKMGGMEEIANIHREHAAQLYGEEPEAPVLTDIIATRNEAIALYDLVQDLGTTVSLKDILEAIMRRLNKIVPFDAGAIFLLESKTGLVVPSHVEGDDAETIRRQKFRLGDGITGWVVDRVKPMVNARPELDFAGNDVEVGRRYKSAAVFPLVWNGICLGTITLYARAERRFSTEDERILERVAPQAASAIQNARSYQENHDRALTDPLTNLPNSRYLYMQLEQELSRARRNNRPMGIVVLDLDRFKPINDAYGHHVGDEVLRQVSRCLTTQFRACDTVCRWAGDEFVVLLPESNPELVETTVLRAQMGLETMEIELPQSRTVTIGASAGWASFPQDGDGFEELMRVADKRMYRNKSHRRQSDRPTLA